MSDESDFDEYEIDMSSVGSSSVYTQDLSMGFKLAAVGVHLGDFFKWYLGDCWEKNCEYLQKLSRIGPEGKDSVLDVFLKKLTKKNDVKELADSLFENQGYMFQRLITEGSDDLKIRAIELLVRFNLVQIKKK